MWLSTVPGAPLRREARQLTRGAPASSQGLEQAGLDWGFCPGGLPGTGAHWAEPWQLSQSRSCALCARWPSAQAGEAALAQQLGTPLLPAWAGMYPERLWLPCHPALPASLSLWGGSFGYDRLCSLAGQLAIPGALVAQGQ